MRAHEVTEWVDVLYAAIPLALATLLFVAQVFWLEPNVLLIGAGITLLGGPKALEWDKQRRARRDDVNDGPGGYWEAPR